MPLNLLVCILANDSKYVSVAVNHASSPPLKSPALELESQLCYWLTGRMYRHLLLQLIFLLKVYTKCAQYVAYYVPVSCVANFAFVQPRQIFYCIFFYNNFITLPI